MEQKEMEEFAFLYLCSAKDRAYVNGNTRMGYRDFERLHYLVQTLGFTELDILFWKKQKKSSAGVDNWIHIYEIEHQSKEAFEGEKERYDSWAKDFCDTAPTKRIRKRLQELFYIDE
jgi:hypothetical protein